MEDINKLDVAAKLFPAVTNKNNSSVFRVSVILKEEIDPRILQLAANMIYERFNLFFFRLRKGFFWHYFDKNHVYFTVEREQSSPCATIIAHENKNFIIKVLYFGNRISVEAFHSVTDGGGVYEYLKSLTYYYLTIKHGPIEPEGKVCLFNEFDVNSDEDSFIKNFSDLKKIKKESKKNVQNSFRIQGVKFSKGGYRAITGMLSVAELKDCCKIHGCTVTAFLVATLMKSIYIEQQQNSLSKAPIVVSIPVNLRKVFNSNTLKNFFGVVNVGYKIFEDTTLQEIIESITQQMELALDESQLGEASGQNVKISNHVILKHTPLIVKNMIVPVGFNVIGETKKTISISNIGIVSFPSEAEKYIEHTEMMLYPTPKSPINCAISTFKDKLSVNFMSSITDCSVIRNFFRTISAQGLTTTIYSNSWGEDDEQM